MVLFRQGWRGAADGGTPQQGAVKGSIGDRVGSGSVRTTRHRPVDLPCLDPEL